MPIIKTAPLILAGLLVLALSAVLSGAEAHRGLLDLRAHDLEKGSLPLNGEWRVSSIRPDGVLETTNSRFVPVPGLFAEHFGTEEGSADYSLGILLPQHVKQVGLYLPVLHSASVLRVNGRAVIINGRTGNNQDTVRHHWQPHNIVLPVSNARIDLEISVANFGYYKGGIPVAPVIGEPETILAHANTRLRYEAFLIGSLIIIGLYHIGLYLLRRRDITPLFFAAFCLLIAARATVTGEYWICQLLPGISWDLVYRIFMLTQTMGAVSFLGFIYLVYTRESPRRAVLLTGSFFMLASLFVLVAPLDIVCKSGLVLDAATVGLVLLTVLIMVRAAISRHQGIVIMLCGFVMLAAAMLHDIIIENQGHHDALLLLPLGLFLFVLSQSFLLSARFSQAFVTIEDLSINLEQKVVARTTELANERNRLKQQSERLQKELAMARTIQMQLIPGKSPSDRIAFFYKPMETIGGDFFDFINLSGGQTGILVSDVSGHGVPAALITSMIKSHMHRYDALQHNPAGVLFALNHQLYNQTGGNFVTAFYGILSADRRELLYASAGHNHPYLISKDGAISLLDHGGRSLPLAVMDNTGIESIDQPYANRQATLPEKGKLLLYTDGLVEATRIDAAPGEASDFESSTLRAVISGLSSLPAPDFIDGLVRALCTYRGSEHFDDDVCMICIDI